MSILLLMTLLPWLLIETVIGQQASASVVGQAVSLSRGILEAFHNNLNHYLEELHETIETDPRSATNPVIATLAETCSSGIVSGTGLQLPRSLEKIVLLPLAGHQAGILLEKAAVSGRIYLDDFYLVRLDAVDAGSSDTFAVLRESPDRTLWLGAFPLVPAAGQGFWLVSRVRHNGQDYIVGLALDQSWLKQFLQNLADATDSQVFLLTADNVVLPEDTHDFFDQPWAGKAQSRTQTGRFINFSALDQAGTTPVPSLIHVFSDPDYLYNMVVVTPNDHLTGTFDRALHTSSSLVLATALILFGLGLAVVLTTQRRYWVVASQFAHITDPAWPLAESRSGPGIAEVEVLIDDVTDMRRRLNDTIGLLETSRRELAASNDRLETRVQERTAELEKTISSLIATQELLVENEKMAVLGRAVSGFTHEINNPLGVCNLAASQMEQVLKDLVAAFEEGTLSTGRFKTATDSLQEGASIIQRSLGQAIHITASFKHMSANQGSGMEQTYDLAACLAEVESLLSPKLRHTSFSLRISCPPGILLRGNPATFYQLLSNLVNNSLIHGFEGRTEGRMRLETVADGEQVVMIYTDNGAGMAEEVRQKVFEPYFTTKAGKGGTGLGLYIVRSLVTDVLRGTVACESTPGMGVQFEFRFPKEVHDDPTASPT